MCPVLSERLRLRRIHQRPQRLTVVRDGRKKHPQDARLHLLSSLVLVQNISSIRTRTQSLSCVPHVPSPLRRARRHLYTQSRKLRLRDSCLIQEETTPCVLPS